ncbi:MAG TPA: hypothetical protein VIP05_33395 [Burkholderiaceae bacterium]
MPTAVTVNVGDPISAPGGHIPPGTTMNLGNWAISPNEQYVLVMQYDGNFVLYEVDGTPPQPNSSFLGYALWATATFDASPPATQARFDAGGDLGVYAQNGATLWNSLTEGCNPTFLAVQDDGNLVLYAAGGTPWSTDTFAKLSSYLPTIAPGSVGRFDGKLTVWHNLDVNGDNGAPPTVSALNEVQLTIAGGYDCYIPRFGESPIAGSGQISFSLTVTPATCTVSCSVTGVWGPFSYEQSGTWNPPTDDEPLLCNFSDGTQLQLSTFDGGGAWYPGVQFQFLGNENMNLCFENMGANNATLPADARAAEPRERRPAEVA